MIHLQTWSRPSRLLLVVARTWGLRRFGSSSSSMTFALAGVKFRALFVPFSPPGPSMALPPEAGMESAILVMFAPNSPLEGFLLKVGPMLEDSTRSMAFPVGAKAAFVCENLRVCASHGVDDSDAGDFKAAVVKCRFSLRDLTSEAGRGIWCGWIGSGCGWLRRDVVRDVANSPDIAGFGMWKANGSARWLAMNSYEWECEKEHA